MWLSSDNRKVSQPKETRISLPVANGGAANLEQSVPSPFEILRPLMAAPACPRCGKQMILVRIRPESPGYDQRTYECPHCEYEIDEVMWFKRTN